MSKDNTVSIAEIARVKRNRETLALLKTFATAVLSIAGNDSKTLTEHMPKRDKGEA